MGGVISQGTDGSTNGNNGQGRHRINSSNKVATFRTDLATDRNKTRHLPTRTNGAGAAWVLEMPVVVKGLAKRRKASSTKPNRMTGGCIGKEGGEVVGM